MAVSVNGLTKKKETEVTASDITSSDVALISDNVSKLVDQIQKALKFNNNSEKDKKELNDVLKDLVKQQEQIQDYLETREKLLRRSENLTKEQRDAIIEDLDREALKIFNNFSSLDKELKDTSLIMASKLGVGKNFNKTFTEILETTKRIEETAKANQSIRNRNESIDSARKKVGETIRGGLVDSLETLLYSSLGPLRIFTDPLFGGRKGFFETLSTLDTAFGKKVNSPTKSELNSKGGTIGKSAVMIANTIEDTLGKSGEEKDGDGLLSSIKDGVASGLGFTSGITLSSVLGTAFKSFFTLSNLTTLGFAGALGLVAWSTFKNEMGVVYEGALEDAKITDESAIDTNNSGSVTIAEMNTAVDNLIKNNRTLLSYFDSIESEEDRIKVRKAILEVLWGNLSEETRANSKDTEEWIKNGSAGVITKDSPEKKWMGGVYDYTDSLTGMKIPLYVPAGEDPEVWGQQYFDSTRGTLSLLSGINASAKAIQTQLTTQYTEEELNALFHQEASKPNPDKEFIENIFGAISAERMGRPYSPSLDFLNDAIIYKDNSVYVPHPDDNIVLTKDDVSAPALSGDFEGTLLDVLRTIAENTGKQRGVYAINSAPEFDFSALRV